MYARRLTVVVTTDSGGDGVGYADVDYGLLSQIRYEKNDFAAGVDFAITVEGTGEGLWTQSDVNASTTKAPRQATHGVDGSASLFASGGTAIQDKIAIAQDRIKIVVAQGGDTKTGTFHFLLV